MGRRSSLGMADEKTELQGKEKRRKRIIRKEQGGRKWLQGGAGECNVCTI